MLKHYHQLAMHMKGPGDILDRADEVARRLLEVEPRNVEAMAISGSLLTIRIRRSRGLFKRMWLAFKAARRLDRAVKIDPDNLSVRTIRAFTGLVLPGFVRRLNSAITDFEYLIRVKEENPEGLPDEMMPKVYLNLGFAYAKKGEYLNAQDVLMHVISDYQGTGEANRAKSLLGRLRERGKL
jgi:tetratricopeptide (TPR) repeat protein